MSCQLTTQKKPFLSAVGVAFVFSCRAYSHLYNNYNMKFLRQPKSCRKYFKNSAEISGLSADGLNE